MIKDRVKNDRATDLGVVRINNDAITTIASVAAMEIRGIYRMGGGLAKTIFETLFKKRGHGGVKIETKDSEVKLTVFIIVEYGVDIPKIADEVQEMVKRSVEKMTGLVLSEVDVVVEGVHSKTVL
ncbi:MAG: Asp23/Gls24 family envelope stress response protein [Candidatus Omnitrophota bacterium]|nr:Asp23/Gls24 family envelope stress response protein [Candidatus Omnitrophota bacterium]